MGVGRRSLVSCFRNTLLPTLGTLSPYYPSPSARTVVSYSSPTWVGGRGGSGVVWGVLEKGGGRGRVSPVHEGGLRSDGRPRMRIYGR